MYKYRGAKSSSINANVLGEELERISEKYGLLTPQIVVEEARSESSPLHNEFTWDDSEAAEKYRLWEARTIIKSIEIVRDDRPINPPAYVNVSMGDSRAYVSLETVVSNAVLMDSAIQHLSSKLAAAEHSLMALQSASESEDHKVKTRIIQTKISEAKEILAAF